MNNNNIIEKRKVVIADDDDDSRGMLAFILEDEGWDVKEAKNGKEAIKTTIQEQPDLLILDNRMPDFTGAEVYQQLKMEGVQLTVILATAYGELEELAATLGITYFISKPFDLSKLLTMIESAYERSLAQNE